MQPTTCPCWSGKSYADCCRPYHLGTPAPDARALMRSRYSAYALGLTDYLLKTTHPQNPHLKPTLGREIEAFSKATRFEGLEIREFVDGAARATVTFCAYLRQGQADVSFCEKSAFEKINGQWLYLDGEKRSIK